MSFGAKRIGIITETWIMETVIDLM